MSKVLVIPNIGKFEISIDGDVWRTCNSNHRYKLTPFIGKRGYYNFYVRVGSKRQHLYLHRLLAMAFLPKPDNLSEVMHLDGDKLNNTISNLCWGSHLDNLSSNNWHHNKGENCGTSKLTWLIVRAIRKLIKRKCPVTQTRLAEYFGVQQSTISNIKRSVSWQGF